jgi:hypothetical protein
MRQTCKHRGNEEDATCSSNFVGCLLDDGQRLSDTGVEQESFYQSKLSC